VRLEERTELRGDVEARKRHRRTHAKTTLETLTKPPGSCLRLVGVNDDPPRLFVPNLHRILAESPTALEAYSALWGVAEKTSFTPVERNVAYLAIIYENECTYCMAGHSNLSRMAHVEGDHIAAVREGRPIADAKLEALRTFAAGITRNRGAVGDAEVEAFKAAGYDNRAVLDVLVLAATKLISNYTNHLADTPLDAFMKGAEWTAPGRLKTAA
jgi:alkylhydroperoxidase family enzyme